MKLIKVVQKFARLKIYAILLLIVLSFKFPFSPISKINAQTSQGLNYGVDTMKIETDIIAGQKVEKEIRIYNLKNDTQTFEFIIKSFQILGESGQIEFKPIDENAIQPVITITPQEVTIPANSSEKAGIELSVSQETGLREYNYIIFISPKTIRNQTDTSRTLIEGQIGILTFINVLRDGKTLGEGTRRGGILEFNLPEINTKSPVKFSAKVGNFGNVHFDAVSNIEIYNRRNALVDKINLKKITIMPGATRNLESADGGEIKWEYDLKLGKYKAVLNIVSADGELQLKEEKTFFVIPLFQLIFALAFIIFLILTVIFIRRNKLQKSKN